MQIDGIPDFFDLSWLNLDSEHYDAMLSVDDKAYVTIEDVNDPKSMKIVGSSLKGRQLPKICDLVVRGLALTLFRNEDVDKYLQTFVDMSGYGKENFVMTFTVTKSRYCEGTMYYQLVMKLIAKGLKPTLGARIRYIKTVDGYTPTYLWNDRTRIDYNYYKERVAEVAARMLFQEPKYVLEVLHGVLRTKLEDWC